MFVRKAETSDLDKIMEIYAIAQDFMIKTGNPNQWAHIYPQKELIEEDIKHGISYLICDDSQAHGVFALASGQEPTYQYIENGEWLNCDEYVTVHRIASDGKANGIFKTAIDYCKDIADNIRIDTHCDNKIMQKLILKNDFKKCGRIYVADGTPRIAYQWSKRE